MLVELQERLVTVVLPRHVCAELRELLQLLLDVLGRGLDVRLDATNEFVVVHFCPRIADDLDVLGEELVAVLRRRSVMSVPSRVRLWRKRSDLRDQKERETATSQRIGTSRPSGGREGKMHTVFFLARSPEAPSTTMTVLSLSSSGLGNRQQLSRTRFRRAIRPTVATCFARLLWSPLLLLVLQLVQLLLLPPPPPEMRRMQQQRNRAELSQSPKQGSSTEIVCHEWRGSRRLTLQRDAYRLPSCWAACSRNCVGSIEVGSQETVSGGVVLDVGRAGFDLVERWKSDRTPIQVRG